MKSNAIAALISDGKLIIGDGYRAKNEELSADGLPFARAQNINDGFKFEGADRFPIRHLAKVGNKVSQPGDVVFTSKGTVGRFALVQPDTPRFVYSPQLCFWRSLDSETIDPRWLFYWMQGREFYEQYKGVAGQTDMADYVSLRDQRAMSISLPKVEEQRPAAEVLSALDDKIAINRHLSETLEAIAQALFQSWFVDFDPVRAKASGEAPDAICQRLGLTPELLALFPDRLVESELGEIPEGWTITNVGEVADVVKGKSYKSSELAPSSVALVTLKSFNRGGGYRLDGLKEYTGSHKPEQKVSAGDLIVAYTDVTQAADVIGKPALVISDERYESLVISLDVAVIRPREPKVRLFLYGLMSGQSFQQHTRSYTTGTTVLHLASNAVPGFRLALPSDDLINSYADIVEPLFDLIDDRVSQSRTLEDLRDALLPRLLTGSVQIAVENIE